MNAGVTNESAFGGAHRRAGAKKTERHHVTPQIEPTIVNPHRERTAPDGLCHGVQLARLLLETNHTSGIIDPMLTE